MRGPGKNLPSYLFGEAPDFGLGSCRKSAVPARAWTDMPVARGGQLTRQAAAAITVCASCPVQQDCLIWAVSHNEPFGIWGGLTPEERDNLYTVRVHTNEGEQ